MKCSLSIMAPVSTKLSVNYCSGKEEDKNFIFLHLMKHHEVKVEFNIYLNSVYI